MSGNRRSPHRSACSENSRFLFPLLPFFGGPLRATGPHITSLKCCNFSGADTSSAIDALATECPPFRNSSHLARIRQRTNCGWLSVSRSKFEPNCRSIANGDSASYHRFRGELNFESRDSDFSRMLSYSYRKRQLGLTNRLVSLLLLATACAASLPLPVSPSGHTHKDRSQPFPCQNRPCGCRNAEQCWKRCCCFSNQEKLAWAKANHVEPPSYVVATARREEEPSSRPSCCSKRSEPSPTDQTSTKSCCSPASQHESRPVDESSHFVLLSFALQCEGQVLWRYITIFSPPSPRLAVRFDEMCCVGSVVESREEPIPISYPPPVPPPRVAAFWV